MDSLHVAAIGIAFSLGVGLLLRSVIMGPVHSVLRRACPSDEGVLFWSRFTMVMLFLGPVLCTLVFGVPPAHQASSAVPSDLVLRVLTTSLVGAFLTLGAIAIRIGTLKRLPSSAAPMRKTDDEFIR